MHAYMWAELSQQVDKHFATASESSDLIPLPSLISWFLRKGIFQALDLNVAELRLLVVSWLRPK